MPDILAAANLLGGIQTSRLYAFWSLDSLLGRDQTIRGVGRQALWSRVGRNGEEWGASSAAILSAIVTAVMSRIALFATVAWAQTGPNSTVCPVSMPRAVYTFFHWVRGSTLSQSGIPKNATKKRHQASPPCTCRLSKHSRCSA
jgi:hypothetical protein